MQATVETRHVPEVQKQTQVDRFLWGLLTTWHALRGKKTEWAKFFGEQEEKLRVYDQRHLDCRPPAGMPLPSSKQPRFLMKPVPVMIAKPAVQPDPAAGQIRRPVTSPPSSPPPPAPVTGETNDDDDAEGSDDPEPEPVHKPAPTTHKKTLSKEEWVVTDEEERKRRRRQKEVRELVPEPTPAKKSAQRPGGDVGGRKKRPRPEEQSTDEESDETDEEERLERRKRKGKGREVVLATEPVKKSSRPAGDARKRHEVKTTGRERDVSCVRCVKGGRACLEQAGGLVACVYCARIKMRCEPASEEVRSTQPAPKKSKQAPAPKPPVTKPTGESIRVKRPAPAAKPSMKQVKEPAPAPPASSSRKKTIKSTEMVVSSDDEPAPAAIASGSRSKRVDEPAPAAIASGSRNKRVNEPRLVPSPVPSPVPEERESAWPAGKKNFDAFETYYRES